MNINELFGWRNDKDKLEAAHIELGKHDRHFKQLNIVDASPTPDRMMIWEYTRKVIGRDVANYAQKIGDCFIEDTQVLMRDGTSKNIQDVCVGDIVVTHKNNFKTVTRTIAKKYSGEMVTVWSKGHVSTLTSTKDHLYVRYGKDSLDKFEWKDSENLLPKEDFTLTPYGVRDTVYNFVDYDGRKIIVDEDFAYIFGWYLAEGGVSGRKLTNGVISNQKTTFNLSKDEDGIADELTDKLKKIFDVDAKKQYHKSDKGSLLLEVYSTKFSTFVKKLFPGNVYTKSIPAVFMTSPAAVKMSILRGWLGGDGCEKPESNRISGVSASHDLIRDIYNLSVSLGIKPNVVFRKRYPHQNVAAKEIHYYGYSYAVIKGTELFQREHSSRWSNFGLVRQIKTVEKNTAEDVDVYCLEVEDDHSFIANGYAVHNCTSFATKNCVEYMQTYPLLAGDMLEFTEVFPPYFYGCSRVLVGGEVGSYQDGSVGAWNAQAVMKYGVLSKKTPDIPEYSGDVAKAWGASGPPNEFVPVGEEHLVKSTAAITTQDQLISSLANLYPVSVCSDFGFDMTQRSDGMFYHSTTWEHNMTFIGYQLAKPTDNFPSHVCLLNNWGLDAHGVVKDFVTGDTWPGGTLRISLSDAVAMLQQSDSFAYSSLDYFKAAPLDASLFNIF